MKINDLIAKSQWLRSNVFEMSARTRQVKRMGLPERYFFENGGRDYILDSNGLSVTDICTTAKGVGA